MSNVVGVLLGVVLGFIASKILFVGSWLTLIPWGIGGLVVGFFTKNKKEAVLSGIIYGFVLSVVFLIAGYNGTRSLLSVLPFFILLGLFGGVCGLVLALAGYFLRRFLRKK